MKIASQEYRPADFSLGQIHEMLVTLGKLGFSPEMAAIVANAKSGKAAQIVSLFEAAIPGADWLETILVRERQCHLDFFGQEFNLASFKAILEEHGAEAISQWQKLGLEPHFLPMVAMAQDTKFDGWEIRPEKWYYERIADGKVLRRQANGSLQPDKEVKLEGITVLIDTRLKPAYKGGRQMFRKDNLLGPVIQRLRQEEKIAHYEYGFQSSRFWVSAEEWENQIKPALAEFLGVETSRVRLERAIEANVIPQLYPYMPRQKDGKTDTWVWYEEYFGDASGRLVGGSSFWGGLSVVDCWDWADGRWGSRAFRPLVVLGP